MDLNSPLFLIALIVGSFIMFKVMINRKKIKTLRKENQRLDYEVKNQLLKNRMIELKEREKELKKKNIGGGW